MNELQEEREGKFVNDKPSASVNSKNKQRKDVGEIKRTNIGANATHQG